MKIKEDDDDDDDDGAMNVDIPSIVVEDLPFPSELMVVESTKVERLRSHQ